MALTVKIRGDASQFEKTMRGVNRSVSNVGAKIAGIGAAGLAAAGAYVSLGQAMEFLKDSSNKAAGMEDLSNNLNTLTGSAADAKRMLKEMNAIADKSTFGVDTYAEAAKTMMAFGISSDDALAVMRNLGDISMGNAEKFQGLSLAFSQAAAGGRLMKEEVNQMVERGFNPLQLIAQRTGESMQALLKRVSAGGVSIDELKLSLVDATSEGGRFHKAMESAMDTTNGKISLLGKSINKLQIAFGTGFNDGLKDALDATNTQLPQLEQRFADAGTFIGQALTDSLTGDMKKFELMGAMVGDFIIAGLQATIITGLDNLGEKIGDALAYGAENLSIASKTMPSVAKGIGGFIRENTRSATNFGEQFTNARESSGFNASQQAVATEAAIEKGIRTGIDASMSDAVKAGILEAWAKQPQGAKFTN